MIPTAENIAEMQKQKALKQKVTLKREIHNNFIDSAIIKSNLSSLKTLFFLSYKLKGIDLSNSKDKKLLTVRLDKKEMLEFTQIDKNTLLKSIKAIQETSVTFFDVDGNIEQGMSLFPRYEVLANKNMIEIDIYIKIVKLIVGVKDTFTPIHVKNLMKVKNAHTLRFLTLLHRIKNYDEHIPKRKRMALNEINAFFGTNYKTWSKVELKLIKPIKEELDGLSDLSFIYESNFLATGRGRPKFDKVTIDLKDNKKRQLSLF